MDKQCPTCGFTGQFEVCPNDQSLMTDMHGSESGDPSFVPSPPLADSGLLLGNSDKKPFMTGQVLGGRYELIEVLGEGGMGVVYRARQTSMDRDVAVKVLSSNFSQNPQMIRRFEKEARVVSKLSHPNTVSVFDYGQSNDVLFLVMELLEGQTLKAFIKENRPLSPPLAVHLITQIIRSLHQAHQVGIVHRDIKPANVFILNENQTRPFAKVLDFGVAKLTQASAEETVTQAGGIIGTPKYMAPEQAQDMQTDHRCDLYSVGILLFEMLAGHAPYDGENPLRIMMDHAQAPVPDLPQPLSETTNYGQLPAIVHRCLQKDPRQRFESAEALLNALDDWEKSSPKRVERPKPTRLSDERPAPPRSVQRSRLWASALLLITVSLFIFWRIEHSATTASPQSPSTTKPVDNRRTVQVKEINLTSKPKASVIRSADGRKIGNTPLKLTIKGDTVVELRTAGFISKSVKFTTQSNPRQHIQLQRKPNSNKTSRTQTTKKKISNPTSKVEPMPVSRTTASPSSAPTEKKKKTKSSHIIELE
ncbi:MAG: serine/threonine protein kinase [Bradymonadia bacterium]